jgi:2,4-dienoyl-CoA reductase-like NADH-dependent reductase (Old Yellow Enzyme family)
MASNTSLNAANDAAYLPEIYPWADKYRVNPGVVLPQEGVTIPKLFEPLTIRNVTIKNRIVLSPLCMYSADRGYIGDFHLAHLSQFALGGAGLIFMEATGVTLEGRISAFCPSLHEDGQIAPIKRIVDVVHATGAKFGMQLGHAGRKASSPPPFAGRGPTIVGTPDSWTPVGPSPIAYAPDWAVPHELTQDEIAAIVQAFVDSVLRARQAGVDVIEIHGAHGYLISNFLSPLSNQRTDEYGGSFENRIRVLTEIVKAVRAVWTGPLFVRVSATEHVEGGWNIEDTVNLAKVLKTLEVDVLDCSSGGNIATAVIHGAPGYQVPYAAAVRKETGLMTMAVGIITEGVQAEEILQSGSADLVAIGRQFLRESSFPLRAARELNVDPTYIPQYSWAINKAAKKTVP